MIRKLIPVLLAATLSACANTGAPLVQPVLGYQLQRACRQQRNLVRIQLQPDGQRPVRKTCDASALQSEIGKKATPPCWKTCARAADRPHAAARPAGHDGIQRHPVEPDRR